MSGAIQNTVVVPVIALPLLLNVRECRCRLITEGMSAA
jgi:hypothetical protein